MDNDKIVESLKDTRSSRTRRADIGINEENDEALKEVGINHFGHYNRSLMYRMCVMFFLKTYNKAYQFGPNFRDAVDIVSDSTINKDIEEVLCGAGEPTVKQLTNLDNITDPYRIIRGRPAIARYIGLSEAWVSLHKKELVNAGAVFNITRGKIGGTQLAAIPYFLAVYFASKFKPDSYPHGFAVTKRKKQ